MTEREQFAERIRLQVQARYAGARVDVDASRFALRLRASGVDVALPLAALEHACARQPQRTPALIAQYVGSLEAHLVPAAAEPLSLSRVLWCVRSTRYLQGLARSDELLRHPVGGDLVAFVAESLPGSVMRGVPRADWEAARISEATLREAAGANTVARFARLLERIAGIDRIPSDGWRLAGDPLYQGSILQAPTVLRALRDRAGGDVLIGVPDRALALVVSADSAGAERFGQRVLREFREGMNPCSRIVVRFDGSGLSLVDRPRRQAPALMPWLSE